MDFLLDKVISRLQELSRNDDDACCSITNLETIYNI